MGLGIQCLIGLKAAALFSSFVYLSGLGFRISSLPFLYASLVSALVSIALHLYISLPLPSAKNRDGVFPFWSLVIFSPYLYFVRGFSALRRFFSGEAPYSEVSEGLYVGGRPYSPEKLPPLPLWIAPVRSNSFDFSLAHNILLHQPIYS